VTIAFPAWMALPEDGLEVNVAVSGDVMAYDESLVKPLEGATHTVRLTRTRPSATLTVRVSPDEYLVKCVLHAWQDTCGNASEHMRFPQRKSAGSILAACSIAVTLRAARFFSRKRPNMHKLTRA
jgi:hypothetical protein